MVLIVECGPLILRMYGGDFFEFFLLGWILFEVSFVGFAGGHGFVMEWMVSDREGGPHQ